jgi:menaquinone-specific isochorismate synthase
VSTTSFEITRATRAGQPIDPATLIAHTAPLDEQDLPTFAEHARRSGRVFERDGLQILTVGVAVRIELPSGLGTPGTARQSLERLAAIERRGAAPIALGALAFDSHQPGSLVVPEVTVVVRPDTSVTAIVVGDSASITETLGRFPFTEVDRPTLEAENAPDGFELSSERSHAEYRDGVSAALEAIKRHEIDKVVLARAVTVVANRPFAIGELLSRLRQLHPGCATFSIDGFLGASPELLVALFGRSATSRPLAGTVARSGDPEGDAALAAGLLASKKEKREHAFVVDAIVSALAGVADGPAEVDGPNLLRLRNVVHLASTIDAEMPDDVGVLDLVAALHPTPAVAGHPRESALAYLSVNEGLDRGRYAGAVGWVDSTGDGEFYLGIRSASIEGSVARLIAGAGIVEGSVPATELAETQLKLQAFLAAAVRP